MDWTKPLAQLTLDDAPATGIKAARLGCLAQAGLPVPTGFVITADALAEMNNERGLDKVGLQLEPGEPLRSFLMKAALRYFGEQDLPLVVRRSLISEDTPAQTLPGERATYYYIFRRDLPRAVYCCWKSFQDRIASTESQPSYNADNPGMGIIVQRMIGADSAGTSYFTDPTGRYSKHMLIEAGWGLGATLVDGRAIPDQYFVDRNHKISHRRIARKRQRVAGDLTSPDEPRLEPVPLALQHMPVLGGHQVNDICRITEEASVHFNAPQELEWAYENGHLSVLQSRTIIPIAASPVPPKGKWIRSTLLTDAVSTPLTPLSADLFAKVLPPFGKFIRGRYYWRFFWLRLLFPFKLPERRLAELMVMQGGPPTWKDISWWRALVSTLLLFLAYLCSGAFWHRSSNMSRASLEQLPGHFEKFKSATLSPEKLLRDLFWGSSPLVPLWKKPFLIHINSCRYILLLGLLRIWVTKFASNLPVGTIEDLCRGRDDMLSRQMTDALLKLTALAQSDKDIRTALSGSPTSARLLLDELPPEHPFLRDLVNFLERFGHQGSQQFELAAPSWREDPIGVILLIRNQIQNPESLSAGHLDRHKTRLAAADKLHQSMSRRWQRRVADELVSRISNHLTLLENTRHYIAMSITLVRERIRAIELELLHKGRLRCSDDIFFLTHAEITQLQRGILGWRDIEERLLRRRQRHRFEYDHASEPYWNLSEEGVALLDKHWLLGQCASPGVAEGRARILLDAGLDNTLESGDILIAPNADMAWAPLFPGAAAIIIEVGSYLSQAGTLAREFGVPCLVNVSGCTERIRDGQRLIVHATDGRVELFDP